MALVHELAHDLELAVLERTCGLSDAGRLSGDVARSAPDGRIVDRVDLCRSCGRKRTDQCFGLRHLTSSLAIGASGQRSLDARVDDGDLGGGGNRHLRGRHGCEVDEHAVPVGCFDDGQLVEQADRLPGLGLSRLAEAGEIKTSLRGAERERRRHQQTRAR